MEGGTVVRRLTDFGIGRGVKAFGFAGNKDISPCWGETSSSSSLEDTDEPSLTKLSSPSDSGVSSLWR
jgi:hypothetical protein